MITLDTIRTCVVDIVRPDGVHEAVLSCGTDLEVGCTVTYQFPCDSGGYCRAYDAYNNIIGEHVAPPADTADDIGGGFAITAVHSKVVFGPTVAVSKCISRSVGDIVKSAESLEDLCNTLVDYGFNDADRQAVVNLYLDYMLTAHVPIAVTQEEYDAIVAAGKVSPTNPYLIVEG